MMDHVPVFTTVAADGVARAASRLVSSIVDESANTAAMHAGLCWRGRLRAASSADLERWPLLPIPTSTTTKPGALALALHAERRIAHDPLRFFPQSITLPKTVRNLTRLPWLATGPDHARRWWICNGAATG